MATTKTIFRLTQLKSAVDKAEELVETLAELAHDNPNNQQLAEALTGATTLGKLLKIQLGNVEQAIQNRLNS